MEDLLAGGEVRELRICWMPRLKGGEETLVAPFRTLPTARIPFRPVRMRPFGDVLGVVYRR
jgi:hypothetical protein